MNVEAIRRKIASAIAKMPTHIELYRDEAQSDGMGGYIAYELQIPAGGAGSGAPEPTTVVFDGLLDNSKHSASTPKLTDSGTTDIKKGASLIAVYDPSFIIKKGDYFTANGTKYTVNNAVNVLEMNIYWECDLEVGR